MYVDDILIFGTTLNVIKEVKTFLSRCFEMKDLGVADVVLNIKLLRDDDGGITLLQSHYVKKKSGVALAIVTGSPLQHLLMQVSYFERIEELLEIN